MSEFKSKKLDSDVWTKAINALYKYESIQQSSKGQATSKLPLLSKPIFAQVTKWWISIDCLISMDCNSIFMINLGTVEFRDKALSDKTHQNHHPSFFVLPWRRRPYDLLVLSVWWQERDRGVPYCPTDYRRSEGVIHKWCEEVPQSDQG